MEEEYNKKTKKELIRILKNRDKKVLTLESKVNGLERRLLVYENAHTPPSKQMFKKKTIQKNGKIGAPKGHPKYERQRPTPTMTVEYSEKSCPYCDSKLGLPAEMKEIIEEEIPEPQPIRVIKHIVNYYTCPNCQKKTIAKNNAPRGCFGKNVQAHITLLKFEDRLPLRKVENSLLRCYNLKITNVGIYCISKQVAKKLGNNHHEIIKTIRSSKILYIDETKYKMNGQTWWLWTFVCENAILFVIRKSRSKKVVEEILGAKFEGIIVSDGWIVYTKFAEILQRCWAHLLRECDSLEEKYKDFEFKNKQIHDLFTEICKIKEDPPSEDKRIILQQKMKEKLEFISRSMLTDRRFKKLGIKILNGLESWFTCVVHIGVESTNNFAEQALRELIIQRKIMGGLRSKDGAVVLERIATCLATWKKQGKPLFETLRNYL